MSPNLYEVSNVIFWLPIHALQTNKLDIIAAHLSSYQYKTSESGITLQKLNTVGNLGSPANRGSSRLLFVRFSMVCNNVRLSKS